MGTQVGKGNGNSPTSSLLKRIGLPTLLLLLFLLHTSLLKSKVPNLSSKKVTLSLRLLNTLVVALDHSSNNSRSATQTQPPIMKTFFALLTLAASALAQVDIQPRWPKSTPPATTTCITTVVSLGMDDSFIGY